MKKGEKRYPGIIHMVILLFLTVGIFSGCAWVDDDDNGGTAITAPATPAEAETGVWNQMVWDEDDWG